MKPDILISLTKITGKSCCERDGQYYFWVGSDEGSVEQPTAQQLSEAQADYDAAVAQYPLDQCKTEARKRIAATDWSVLPDVGISNIAEFEAYRAALRELIKNPVADPVWPTEPQPVWS